MAMIIGIFRVSFTPKDADGPINGLSLFVSEPIPPKRGQGDSAQKIFLSDAKLADIGFIPTVGQSVTLRYNRYNKVDYISANDPVIDLGGS